MAGIRSKLGGFGFAVVIDQRKLMDISAENGSCHLARFCMILTELVSSCKTFSQMCPWSFCHFTYFPASKDLDIIHDKILIFHIPMCGKIQTCKLGTMEDDGFLTELYAIMS